jgi:sulfopyruvate decarboxylase TPP-binding subunit
MNKEIDWPGQIHRELKAAGIRIVGFVPDGGHKRLIELCLADKSLRTVVLSTEEEGIGLAAGAWLGGEKAVLLMQSSGVGNVVNVIGMNKECRFPLVSLVTMPRGGERRGDRPDRQRRVAPCLQQLRFGGGADRPARHRHQELPGPDGKMREK